MTSTIRAVLLTALASTWAFGQADKPSGAREYFFLGVQKKDALPSVKQASLIKRPRSKPSAGSDLGAVHLGLRYNLLLVDGNTGKSRIVDPDRQFKVGECFAIELSSNRSGYLYVLAKESSGTWMPLVPSPKMPEESNVIDPGQTVKVPKTYCFKVENPPGDEELFVALSRDPYQASQLQQSIDNPAPPAEAPEAAKPATAPDPETLEMADARDLNSQVATLRERFATRDISIVKVGAESAKADEPPHAVYVVNQSAKPTSNLVTRIVVHHR